MCQSMSIISHIYRPYNATTNLIFDRIELFCNDSRVDKMLQINHINGIDYVEIYRFVQFDTCLFSIEFCCFVVVVAVIRHCRLNIVHLQLCLYWFDVRCFDVNSINYKFILAAYINRLDVEWNDGKTHQYIGWRSVFMSSLLCHLHPSWFPFWRIHTFSILKFPIRFRDAATSRTRGNMN